MKTAIRILLILVMLEAVVAVAVLGRIAWRTAAQTPDVSVSDPLIMPHLRRLARQAEFGDAKAWTRLGEALLGKGFYAHAELAFREALRRDSQDFAAQFGLAFCLDRTGRTQESDPEYQKALRLSTDGLRPGHPGKAETLYAMGRNALRRENLINAEDLFRQNAGYP
ncbi:MAG: tetratricopeptide repeat protein, partial [Blastopirellula sp. JB062]